MPILGKVRNTFSSVQFSLSVVSDSLWPHGPQHAGPPCPSPTPGAHPNSCPLSWWCHPTISSTVVPFLLPSIFPTLFQWVSSSHQVAKVLGVSALASVLPMSIQDWFHLGWTGWISLQSKGLSRVLWVRWMMLQFSAPGKECELIAATSVWKFYQLNSIYNFSWTMMWGMSQVFSPETVYLYKRRYGLWEAWYTPVFSSGGLPFTTYMTCDKLPSRTLSTVSSPLKQYSNAYL